jgi:hypothetical protein
MRTPSVGKHKAGGWRAASGKAPTRAMIRLQATQNGQASCRAGPQSYPESGSHRTIESILEVVHERSW